MALRPTSLVNAPGSGLEVAPAEKASLMGSQFYSKQVREQLSLLCLVSVFLSAILWPSELPSSCVCFLILMHMGVLIVLGVFPQFLLKVSDIMVPKLSIIFRRRIRLGTFPECWWSANVTTIPKGAPSPDREN